MSITADMSGDDFWLTNSVHFANQRTFTDTTNLIDKEYRKSTEDFYSTSKTNIQTHTHQLGFLANY